MRSLSAKITKLSPGPSGPWCGWREAAFLPVMPVMLISTLLISVGLKTVHAEPPDMRGFVARMSRSGLERASIARKLSTVRSFLRFAVREGRIEVNPASGVATPKVPRALPRDLTVDETFNLLDHISDDDLASSRDRAILELLYATGLRVGELVSLSLDDVDLSEGIVRVRGKGGKERLVPFGGQAAKAMRRWIERSRPLRIMSCVRGLVAVI